MRCPVCEKGDMKRKVVPYSVYGIELGRFPADVCDKCGEEWFDEKTALKIEELQKEKGLFGLSRESKISYSGNSLVIRIPNAIAKFVGLKKEKHVMIHPEGKNKLEIEILN
jgi:YgiT-type zinc finger domain-containing protein